MEVAKSKEKRYLKLRDENARKEEQKEKKKEEKNEEVVDEGKKKISIRMLSQHTEGRHGVNVQINKNKRE